MKIIMSIVFSFAIAGAGVLTVFFALTLKEETADALTEEAIAESLTTKVRIQVLEPATVEDSLKLTGQLIPWKSITISAEANGNIEQQHVERGDIVKAEQELFHIDTINIRANHRQAEARSTLAEQELKRIKGLQKSGISSPQALDQAMSERTFAAADLAATEVRFQRSVVYAPFDGVVDELFREENEFVDFGTELLRIIQLDKLKAIVPIPERDIVFFSEGDKVDLQLEALPDSSFTGTIYRINPSADRATRTFPVEIEVDNSNAKLKPGMTIRATLVRQHFEDAIVVPIYSVLAMENQRFAVVEQEGVAHWRAIEVAGLQGSMVHVSSGLEVGEHLIVKGQRELRDGQLVEVIPGAAE